MKGWRLRWSDLSPAQKAVRMDRRFERQESAEFKEASESLAAADRDARSTQKRAKQIARAIHAMRSRRAVA